jgi:hypothetical protein
MLHALLAMFRELCFWFQYCRLIGLKMFATKRCLWSQSLFLGNVLATNFMIKWRYGGVGSQIFERNSQLVSAQTSETFHLF